LVDVELRVTTGVLACTMRVRGGVALLMVVAAALALSPSDAQAAVGTAIAVCAGRG
jgi:hypothetical protein